MQTWNPYPNPISPSTAKYHKTGSFQIISAGANANFDNNTGYWGFGTGSVTYVVTAPPAAVGWYAVIAPYPVSVNSVYSFWTPTTAFSVFPVGSDGYDDQANFHGSLLGIGQ
jgi:hypothetical protein